MKEKNKRKQKQKKKKKKRTEEKMRPSVQLTYFNTIFDEFNLQCP